MLWFVAIAALFIGAKYSLVLGGITYVVGYVLSCWWFDLARCLCCSGSGKHWRKDRKVFRRCWWCSGRGARRRIGRMVWDAMFR